MFSSLFNTLRKDWSINVPNHVQEIRKPSPGKGRDRRLVDDEEDRLLTAASDSFCRTKQLALAIILAIETGMRAGELVSLEWSQVDLPNNTIRLDTTKNGDCRNVPLTSKAEALIRSLPRPINGGRLFTFHDSNGLSASFRAACKRADIVDLRFHDLRHEAASRFAPKMQVTMLAQVMGWRSIQMAMRYHNAKASDLVDAVRSAVG